MAAADKSVPEPSPSGEKSLRETADELALFPVEAFAFVEEGDARDAARRTYFNGRRACHRTAHAYRCPHCGMHHVTSKAQEAS